MENFLRGRQDGTGGTMKVLLFEIMDCQVVENSQPPDSVDRINNIKTSLKS